MVSLKVSKKAREEEYEPSPMDEDYGWGSRMLLHSEQVDGLGLGGVKAGQEVAVTGVAVVRSVASRDADTQKGGPKTTIELQMTDMEADPNAGKGRSREETAASLYPSSDE